MNNKNENDGKYRKGKNENPNEESSTNAWCRRVSILLNYFCRLFTDLGNKFKL
jgi:hypothetical protein